MRVLLSVALFVAAFQIRGEEISIATAQSDGTYYLVGSALKSVLERKDIIGLELLETEGSVENLRLIADADSRLAIVQSDILNEHQDLIESAAIRGVAVLFQEYSQIVVGRHSTINRPLNLVGKRLYIGAPESGSRKNALDILRALGITLADFEERPNYAGAYAALADVSAGNLDGVIMTSSQLAIADSEAGRDLKLVSLSERNQASIREHNPLYSFTEVANSDGTAVTLMTSRAVLVTSLTEKSVTIDPSLMRDLLEVIDNDLELELARQSGRDIKLNSASLLAYGMPLPLHPVAESFYREKHYILNLEWLQIFIVGLILTLAMAFGVHFGENWKTSIRIKDSLSQRLSATRYDQIAGAVNLLTRNPFFLTLWILSSLLLIDIYIILLVESAYAVTQDTTSPFADLGLSELLIWLITFAATGYPQDLFPNSLSGKIAAGAIPLIGLANVLFLLFYSNFKKNERRAREARGQWMPHLQGHIVICGWNEHAVELVHELTCVSLNENARRVLVIAQLSEEQPFQRFRFRPGYFYFYRGDSSEIELLKRANVEKSMAVIVLADERRLRNRNLRSIYTVTAVRSAIEHVHAAPSATTPRIIAELYYPENLERFERAGVDKILPLEQIRYRLLLGATICPGISGLLYSLMSSQSSFRLALCGVSHFRRIPELVGSSFAGAHDLLAKRQIQLVAVYRHNRHKHAATDLTFAPESPYCFRPGLPERNQQAYHNQIGSGDDLLVIESRSSGARIQGAIENPREFSNTKLFSEGDALVVIARSFDQFLADYCNTVARYCKSTLLVVEGPTGSLRSAIHSGIEYIETPNYAADFLDGQADSAHRFLNADRLVIVGANEIGTTTTVNATDLNPDDWAMCAAMASRAFFERAGRADVQVVVELKRTENLWLCGDLGVSQAVPTNLITRLVTRQMTEYGGLVSEFLLKLLDYSEQNSLGVLRKIGVAELPDSERQSMVSAKIPVTVNVPGTGPCLILALQKQNGLLKMNPAAQSDGAAGDWFELNDSIFVLAPAVSPMHSETQRNYNPDYS